MKVDKKSTRIFVKISILEKEEIKKRAKELGINMAAYMRNKALNHRIIIKTDKEMVRQIRHIGNNINQIARQLNTYSDGLIIAEAYKQMEEYKQMLQIIIDYIEKK